MEPRIQYAQTKDGVSIAYWVLGEGMPFVEMPSMPFSHVQLEMQVPLWRAWNDALSERWKHVRYDHRGSGLSERNVTHLSLDALILDLEAVVDSLGLQRFALFGHHITGAAAITYAVQNPERVSHLILWCSYSKGADAFAGPEISGSRALLDRDWVMFTETLAHIAYGWPHGEEAHRIASLMRECATPEIMRAWFALNDEVDVTDLLPEVRVPTLVVQRREYPLVPLEIAKGIASRIPGAQLALVEGISGATYMEDMEALAQAIEDFLGEGEEAAAEAEPTEPGAFRTILFTDVEGSTALTQRLGDARARELLREHERMVREALKAHSGSELKTMGDGFMTSFSSATRALECAIAMQRAFAAHNESAAEPIMVRVGLNAGEPIAEEAEPGREDLFGTAVIMAARIAAKAQGGEILTSDTVRGLVAGKRFLFSDRGETALRGFEDPVRLFELRWREEK